MGLRSVRAWLAVAAGLALAVTACSGQATPSGQGGHAADSQPKVAYANIGGYLLAYECAGTGSPTVILEAGYTASGISTYGPVIVPALARRTRVCTYETGPGTGSAMPARLRCAR